MTGGVYGWIRDGVRRAVLLGFSDAVEQIGMPHAETEMNPQFAALLQGKTASAGPALPHRPQAAGGKRRLGRTLADTGLSVPSSAAQALNESAAPAG